MNIEVRLKCGVADHVVKREGVGADDVAEVGVKEVTIQAALEPVFDEGDHGVGFAAGGGKAADEICAFLCLGAIPGNESGNGLIVDHGDENFDIIGVCGNVAFGEVEEGGVEGFGDLGMGEH